MRRLPSKLKQVFSVNLNQILFALRPRFSWWRGNEFDIRDAVLLLLLVLGFLPVLPWKGRERGNYLPALAMIDDVARLYDAPSLVDKDPRKIISGYYKSMGVPPRESKCLVARDVMALIGWDELALQHKVQEIVLGSNVPIVFAVDAMAWSFLMRMVSKPSFNTVAVDIAEKCVESKDEFIPPVLVRQLLGDSKLHQLPK